MLKDEQILLLLSIISKDSFWFYKIQENIEEKSIKDLKKEYTSLCNNHEISDIDDNLKIPKWALSEWNNNRILEDFDYEWVFNMMLEFNNNVYSISNHYLDDISLIDINLTNLHAMVKWYNDKINKYKTVLEKLEKYIK